MVVVIRVRRQLRYRKLGLVSGRGRCPGGGQMYYVRPQVIERGARVDRSRCRTLRRRIVQTVAVGAGTRAPSASRHRRQRTPETNDDERPRRRRRRRAERARDTAVDSPRSRRRSIPSFGARRSTRSESGARATCTSVKHSP